MEKIAAIVLAAGAGKRMNSAVHKQYMLLEGKPVLYYALKAFEESEVTEIILVVGAGEEEYCRTEIIEKYGIGKVGAVVQGGRERYHSVYAGLNAAQGADYVLIHDGARPLVTADIIKRSIECVRTGQSCVVGMPVKDTIKIADENGFAQTAPNRDRIWQVQTPQVFTAELAKRAYEELLIKEGALQSQGIQITDDAMVVETLLHHPVKLVEGSYENIKITTPEDLKVAESFL